MKNYSLFKLNDTISALGIFSLISIPSLKILYSSEIVNAVPIIFLSSALILNLMRALNSAAVWSLIVWTMFSIVLLSTGLIDSGGAGTVIKYIYLIISVFLVILNANERAVAYAAWLVVFWGLFIATWQLSVGVPTDRELGQHYLTAAMPIGAALASALISALLPGAGRWGRLRWLVVAAVLLIALSTMLARAALVFSLSAAAIVGFAYLFFASMRFRKRMLALLRWLMLGIIIYVPASHFLQLQQIARLKRLLESWEEESRIEVYNTALSYIAERPIIGYGFGSSERLFGNYPHNIFLEIMTHGGVILIVFFIPILYIFARYLIIGLKFGERNFRIIGFSATAIFLFLQWNVSFSFSGAYIPIACLFAFAIGASPSSGQYSVRNATKIRGIDTYIQSSC